ncbi:DUF3298 and DUF4163 domain-containing protein [Fulvivirga sp. 29W222]|uniref:DUF3298 and DUF4163 domain-containing protein n=1 Tax=Fulvivirga marina TaxID=2494733 RepID=A0A937KA87_9BACT|nr:DUF3298 and DUF4163 domain-containing protein [Fulvivirga marina]MBL6444871.1 DUF3298 and DUF4163 domain-containing protein [Fulvivirga marina]
MKTTHLLPLLLLAITLTNCDIKTTQETLGTEATDTVTERASLYYEFTSFIKKYGDCKTDTSVHCTRINLNYPIFKSEQRPELTNRINNETQEAVLQLVFPDTAENKSLELFADRFISDYKEIKEAFGEAFGWYANLDGKVLRNDSLIVSLELAADMYTGGAHGSYYLQYLNFDVKTGNKLAFESLFVPNFGDKLNDIVELEFRKKYDIKPNQDLSDEGFQFENGKYYNDNNFALLPEGIKFYYNSYEIAPYSKGPSEILVKYTDLKGLLKENLMVM